MTTTSTTLTTTPTQYPLIGSPSIMSQKTHGTSDVPIQAKLRFGANPKLANRICNFNRHYAEPSGHFRKTKFVQQAKQLYERDGKVVFYDSNTGKPLFVLDKNRNNNNTGRSWNAFIQESTAHGWPSFRDSEVVWEHVRCLPGGEAVSLDGTHLGHNLPDAKGNRYCINLVSIAGFEKDNTKHEKTDNNTDEQQYKQQPNQKAKRGIFRFLLSSRNA